MKDETYSERIAREDALVKEMEEKLGQPWETAVLDLVNAPAAHALDHLWREIIYTQHGEEYGDWEYPGQAYRHLKAEYDELRAENGRLRAELEEARELLDKALDGRAFYAVCQHCKIVQTIERHMVFEDESCACIVCGTDWHPERQEPEIFIDGDDIPF